MALYDPHIHLYVRAKLCVDPEAVPCEEPAMQELRRVRNLGHYSLAQLEDLLDELETEIENWVESNPPTEP